MNTYTSANTNMELGSWIAAIPGSPEMKKLLQSDLEIATQKKLHSFNPQSPYQVFGETQKDLIIQFQKTGDMSYLQQYIQNRTDYYANFNLGIPDNGELYQLSSNFTTQETMDSVSGKVFTIVDSASENVILEPSDSPNTGNNDLLVAGGFTGVLALATVYALLRKRNKEKRTEYLEKDVLGNTGDGSST